MLLHNGTQVQSIAETTTGAGTTSKEVSIQTDSVLVSLFIPSVSSGSLSLTIYTLTDTGKEVSIITFPSVSSPTSNLLLRKSGSCLQRIRIEATYTGIVQYEVYIRAMEGAGESSTRILGAAGWSVSQVTVGTSPVAVIPASLTDRQGLLVKNWSITQTVYIAESSGNCTSAVGYPLAPRDGLALDVAAGVAIYAVSDAAGADVRLVEASS